MPSNAATLAPIPSTILGDRQHSGPKPYTWPAAVMQRTKRAPPPVEDDVDLVGYALLLLLFMTAVW